MQIFHRPFLSWWQDFGNRKSRTVHTAISHVLYSLFTQHDSLPLTGSFLLSSIPSSRHDWRPFLLLFHSPSLCVCDRLNFFRIWRNEWFIFGQLNLWAKFIDLLFPSISTLCVSGSNILVTQGWLMHWKGDRCEWSSLFDIPLPFFSLSCQFFVLFFIRVGD